MSSSSYSDITPDLLDIWHQPFCYFCGAPIWIDDSQRDFANPDSKPIIRNAGDLTSFHTCAAGNAIRGW